MSHIPGPWTAWMHEGRWRIDGPTRRPLVLDDSEGQRWLVAETLTDNREDEANARLIAAAPELLEALRSYEVLDGPTWNQCRKAAIAKAEGK